MVALALFSDRLAGNFSRVWRSSEAIGTTSNALNKHLLAMKFPVSTRRPNVMLI